MEPAAEQMVLPAGYGSPKEKLKWAEVNRELEDAGQYWVASVRPDGRPHVVPRDGIWLDDTWYYGGADNTVHNRNLQHNQRLAMHVGDGLKAIIVEGEAKHIRPSRAVAERLAEAHNRKYGHYGMNATAETYTGPGTWSLKASRILAWTNLPENATRFIFD